MRRKSPGNRVAWVATFVVLMGLASGLAWSGSADAAQGFLCSAGSNDNAQCDFDSDCPGGACLFAQDVCVNGANDSQFCMVAADCPNGTCTSTAKVCSAGDNKGFACAQPGHCPGGSCISNGKFCYGGAFDHEACITSDDCLETGSPAGVCRGPGTPVEAFQFCSSPGQSADGSECTDNSNCPGGACVLAQDVCSGGTNTNGSFCESDTDCDPGNTCTATQKICSAGSSKGIGCLNTGQCPTPPAGVVCKSSGLICNGGDFDLLSCIDDADCGTTTPGDCISPGVPTVPPRSPTPRTGTHRPTPIPTQRPTNSGGGSTPTVCGSAGAPCVIKIKNGGCTMSAGGGGSLATVLLVSAVLWLRRFRVRRAHHVEYRD